MKFFSNEAKENTDDNDPDRTDADRTDANVAAVPAQRAGSPWSDAPRDADDELADRERRDGTDEVDAQRTGDRPADANRPWSQAGDAPGSETAHTTTTYEPDGTVVTKPGDDVSHDSSPADDRDRVDATDAVKDEGTFDSPKAVDPATGEPLHADRTDADRTDRRDADDATDTHVGTAAVPVAAPEPVTTPAQGDATPVVAAAAPAAADRLFPDGDSFAERFRDIQLRFVDSPKEATAEAADLVNEAVDKLTSNLRSQRDSLTGDSDDTEKLRVELRAYRDLLNRLVNL